ncbi:MAG: XRE family transcriptional regulator [Comamonadaceae bacterium]|nr:MAG: XRE family transcriptional regulator [Comamonadaceae bacterium]
MELRGESSALKKASAQYRTDIAALKRQVLVLERQLSKLAKGVLPADASSKSGIEGASSTRFSAKRLAAHRTRLGLSAAEMGRLLNCSGQSIYKWEQEKARPRAVHMPAIAALRTHDKSRAAEVLASG